MIVDYFLLTGQQREQISLRKLLDLESEHHALDLDIRLATASGIENDRVEAARNQAIILERQISILISWVQPPAEPEEEDAEPVDMPVANGRKPALAR